MIFLDGRIQVGRCQGCAGAFWSNFFSFMQFWGKFPQNMLVSPLQDCSSGSRGPRRQCPPPSTVKISHKKDCHQRWPHRFHASAPPLPICWIRYWIGAARLQNTGLLCYKYRSMQLNCSTENKYIFENLKQKIFLPVVKQSNRFFSN